MTFATLLTVGLAGCTTTIHKTAPHRPVAVQAKPTIKGRIVMSGKPVTWDLLVVGPDFARELVIGVNVESNVTTDLGDIAVSPGRTIRGYVKRPDGSAVLHATVEIDCEPWQPVMDELTRRARGCYGTTSESKGRVDPRERRAGARWNIRDRSRAAWELRRSGHLPEGRRTYRTHRRSQRSGHNRNADGYPG